MLWWATGCVATRPVVSSTSEKKQTDSTLQRSSEKESSSHIEKVEEKTIPESDIDLSLTVAKMDSIIYALKNIPKGVPQTIVIKDKIGQAQFTFLLDSIGNLHARCTSIEKKYFEKSVFDQHMKESLVLQLTKVNTELHEAKAELMQLKKPWYEKIEDVLQNLAIKILLIVICIGVVLMIIRAGLAYVKKLWLKLFP
jgi:hypothetical protein